MEISGATRRGAVAARMSCWVLWTVRAKQMGGFERDFGSRFCWPNFVGMGYCQWPAGRRSTRSGRLGGTQMP
jgi:hypothetical protein